MLKDIRQFFEQFLHPGDAESDEDRVNEIHLASAALLFEMIYSEQDASKEWETASTILQRTFALDETTLNNLTATAEASIREAHDFHQFTQLINQHYDYDDKKLLIEDLWRVAFADGRLDKYEEHFIRRIAGLLHIAHTDFIQAKIRVKQLLA